MQGEKNVEDSLLNFVRSWMLGHEWSVDTGGEEREEVAVFFAAIMVMQSHFS